MQVRSLGYSTDLLFPRFDGHVHDRGDYLSIHTPRNPNFYWGNFLLFPAAPAASDLRTWPTLFEREHPGAGHLAFGWDDDDDGAASDFAEAGYTVCEDTVLVTEGPAPRRVSSGFQVRPLSSDADWDAQRTLNIACDEREGSSPTYDEFKEALRVRYRAMVVADHGRWLGAFADGRLIGALGIFSDAASPTLSRLQSVETHPDHRGRGVCAALTAAAIATGLSELGATRVVVVAEPASQAERIYRRAGFRAVSRQRGVHRVIR